MLVVLTRFRYKIFRWNLIAAWLLLCPLHSEYLYSQTSWNDKNENENYTPRHECSFVQAGNRFYLMGGRENARTIDIYNYSNNSWTSLVNSAPVEFNHYQATEYQGLIWIIGAFKNNAFPNESPADHIWIFDPAAQAWIQGPAIPTARRRGSAGLVVYNEKLYVIAGNTQGHNGGYVSWFDEYDPQTATWRTLQNAPRARDHFHAAVIGNKLYAVGGRRSGGPGGTFKPVIAEVDVYNFSSGTWSTLPSSQDLPTPRGAPAVASFNSKLIVAGGEVENELVYGVNTSGALDITEQFDPATGNWSRIGDLNHNRHGTQAIVSGGGVFVIAGSPNLGGGNQKNMEYLGTDSPSGSSSNNSILSGPASVTVPNGGNTDFDLDVINGNIGVYIRSVSITGPDASDFSIISGSLDNLLLKNNSSKSISVGLTAGADNRTATLNINYGVSSTLSIPLNNGNSPPVVVNPGTQNDTEGDSITLQIQASDASPNLSYSGSDLPPGLSIDNNTGLISGEIVDGAGSNSPYNVSITVTDDGIPVESTSIFFSWIVEEINQPPQASATADPVTGSAPLEVSFSGIGSSDDTGIISYFWNFDDGSSSDLIAPIHTFQNPGTYEVDLTVMDNEGLTDSAIVNISVNSPNQPPEAVANAMPLSGDAPLEVLFTGSNSTDDATITSYLWDFGDGGVSNMADPQHVYTNAGNYNVSLTVTDGEGLQDSAMLNISVGAVNEPPVAVATASVFSGDAPLEISFLGSQSTDDTAIESYLWDFDDGSTSEEADPVHVFVQPGTYNVILTVFDNEGLSATATSEILVNTPNQPPVALATASPTSGDAPLEVSFNGSNSSDDSGIVSYLWSFGDGSESSIADPVHIFLNAGEYEVRLEVNDAEGASNATSLIILVSEGENIPEEEDIPEDGTVPEEENLSEAILIENPTRSGTIKLKLNNSASDQIALQFNIHDLGGKLLGVLDAQEYFDSDGIFEIPVTWLNDGIYLLGVEMNKGDFLQFKVLVRN